MEPGRLFLVSRLIVVSDVVKVAVNIEQMQIPIRIQHTAKVLPNREMGARSPYLCFHTSKEKTAIRMKLEIEGNIDGNT